MVGIYYFLKTKLICDLKRVTHHLFSQGDTKFKAETAKVACKEMGYLDYKSFRLSSNCGYNFISFFFLSEVVCSGTESNLLNCQNKK